MRPDFLKQGDAARLFPVLSTTSKEGRTTSIFLATLCKVEEFGRELLGSVGAKVGARSKITTYTEVVFDGPQDQRNDRPDGLIIVRTAGRSWTALVEAKVGNAVLETDQLERYRVLAKQHSIDAVISISNQFATAPEVHPLEDVRRSRSRIPVFHWSWMSILTAADLLASNEDVEDSNQAMLLNELVRFLSHESAGVKGFDRMPAEWSEVNRLIAAGGKLAAKSLEGPVVLGAWHQETRDLSLILTRQTETRVTEKLPRKHKLDNSMRQKDELLQLREQNTLSACFNIPNAAAPLEVIADIPRRTIDIGMMVRAPEDRVSSKARVTWLLRQIKTENTQNLHVRVQWPGRSEPTQFSFDQLQADPSLVEVDKKGLQASAFFVFASHRLGARFAQQSNFISDLEGFVPQFYGDVGQGLTVWARAAPKIKEGRVSADDVSIESLEEDANEQAEK